MRGKRRAGQERPGSAISDPTKKGIIRVRVHWVLRVHHVNKGKRRARFLPETVKSRRVRLISIRSCSHPAGPKRREGGKNSEGDRGKSGGQKQGERDWVVSSFLTRLRCGEGMDRGQKEDTRKKGRTNEERGPNRQHGGEIV